MAVLRTDQPRRIATARAAGVLVVTGRGADSTAECVDRFKRSLHVKAETMRLISIS